MKQSKRKRAPTSTRWTPEGWRLLGVISNHLGVNRSNVLEMAVRAFAHQHGIATETPPPGDQS